MNILKVFDKQCVTVAKSACLLVPQLIYYNCIQKAKTVKITDLNTGRSGNAKSP